MPRKTEEQRAFDKSVNSDAKSDRYAKERAKDVIERLGAVHPLSEVLQDNIKRSALGHAHRPGGSMTSTPSTSPGHTQAYTERELARNSTPGARKPGDIDVYPGSMDGKKYPGYWKDEFWEMVLFHESVHALLHMRRDELDENQQDFRKKIEALIQAMMDFFSGDEPDRRDAEEAVAIALTKWYANKFNSGEAFVRTHPEVLEPWIAFAEIYIDLCEFDTLVRPDGSSPSGLPAPPGTGGRARDVATPQQPVGGETAPHEPEGGSAPKPENGEGSAEPNKEPSSGEDDAEPDAATDSGVLYGGPPIEFSAEMPALPHSEPSQPGEYLHEERATGEEWLRIFEHAGEVLAFVNPLFAAPLLSRGPSFDRLLHIGEELDQQGICPITIDGPRCEVRRVVALQRPAMLASHVRGLLGQAWDWIY